ncbi:Pycsar system effector family protein [Micromonospora sp. NPDC049662]|uniref:Pycsar system effector family protein n=1 Tax=Micromonospora sp. NPDC049662 TaxID=3155397 RepID=UPI0034224A29
MVPDIERAATIPGAADPDLPPPVAQYEIPTVGGALVVIRVPEPGDGIPAWDCLGCGASEMGGDEASEVATVVAAGAHAVRCGHDVMGALEAEISDVKAESQRVDPKAANVLQVAGVLASVGFVALAGVGRLLPLPALAVGGVSAVLVLAAILLLLRAGRPQLNSGVGFVGYVGLDPATIVARLTPANEQSQLTAQHLARELEWRSRLLLTKFTLIRRAVPLLAAAFIGAYIVAGVLVVTALR